VRAEGLYDELLVAAVRLASTELSLAIPSLRAVARECGVSATAVYRHFSSQSALNRAVLLTVDASFVAALTTADDDPSRTSRERLRRIAHAYLGWGLANPGLYQLRFESADQLGDDYVRSDAADKLLTAIGSLLRDTGAAEPLTAEDVWGSLHGVVSLRIHKRALEWSTPPDAQLERLLTQWGLPR
jgi:AcrR family transcriptional regulator